MIPEWLFQVASVVGAIGGAFVGVKLAVARLEVRVANLEQRQAEHRSDDSDRFKELGDRVLRLERPTYRNHQ